eukprot:m.275607 g.275607  ORF g.275607 m.275607 type:complete len:652 (+) comp11096_c1_seq5:505-2460(+)
MAAATARTAMTDPGHADIEQEDAAKGKKVATIEEKMAAIEEEIEATKKEKKAKQKDIDAKEKEIDEKSKLSLTLQGDEYTKMQTYIEGLRGDREGLRRDLKDLRGDLDRLSKEKASVGRLVPLRELCERFRDEWRSDDFLNFLRSLVANSSRKYETAVGETIKRASHLVKNLDVAAGASESASSYGGGGSTASHETPLRKLQSRIDDPDKRKRLGLPFEVVAAAATANSVPMKEFPTPQLDGLVNAAADVVATTASSAVSSPRLQELREEARLPSHDECVRLGEFVELLIQIAAIDRGSLVESDLQEIVTALFELLLAKTGLSVMDCRADPRLVLYHDDQKYAGFTDLAVHGRVDGVPAIFAVVELKTAICRTSHLGQLVAAQSSVVLQQRGHKHQDIATDKLVRDGLIACEGLLFSGLALLRSRFVAPSSTSETETKLKLHLQAFCRETTGSAGSVVEGLCLCLADMVAQHEALVAKAHDAIMSADGTDGADDHVDDGANGGGGNPTPDDASGPSGGHGVHDGSRKHRDHDGGGDPTGDRGGDSHRGQGKMASLRAARSSSAGGGKAAVLRDITRASQFNFSGLPQQHQKLPAEDDAVECSTGQNTRSSAATAFVVRCLEDEAGYRELRRRGREEPWKRSIEEWMAAVEP